MWYFLLGFDVKLNHECPSSATLGDSNYWKTLTEYTCKKQKVLAKYY